jgi:hypothetical protein
MISFVRWPLLAMSTSNDATTASRASRAAHLFHALQGRLERTMDAARSLVIPPSSGWDRAMIASRWSTSVRRRIPIRRRRQRRGLRCAPAMPRSVPPWPPRRIPPGLPRPSRTPAHIRRGPIRRAPPQNQARRTIRSRRTLRSLGEVPDHRDILIMGGHDPPLILQAVDPRHFDYLPDGRRHGRRKDIWI